ncbi:MAG: Wzz/FepE/Etk N-terminal domain-containing protein, partial [Chitinophagaceae bacterium]
MEQDIESQSLQGSNALSIKEHILKYLAYWPLFLVCFVLFVGAGIAYTRYATPKYTANAEILIKGSQNSTASRSSDDLIENALSGGQKTSLENELRLIRSSTLMQRVVSKNSFNISYHHIGSIRKTDMYTDVPFRLLPQLIKDSSRPFTLRITEFTTDGGIIETGSEENTKKFNFKWNVPFASEEKTFLLVKRGNTTPGKAHFEVTWNPIRVTVGEILKKLSVGMLDAKTSIINISLLIEHPRRGQEILNALASEFNLADIEERNIISQNTIRFIDDRLSAVSTDLSDIEGKKEGFQSSQSMIEPGAQSAQSFGNSDQLTQEIADLRLKQKVAQSLTGYFNKPNADDLVPSTLGLDDPTLGSLIVKYNELQSKKQKEAPSLTEGGLIMQDINNQIKDVKGNVLEALTNYKGNLRQSEGNLQAQNGQYRSFINALPRKTRGLLEITRKQSITESLYIYLANKREEAAIQSTASSISNFKQIEPAGAYGPVEPNTKNILIYTALLGLLLPVGLIFLKDLVNDKINTRRDISNSLDNP